MSDDAATETTAPSEPDLATRLAALRGPGGGYGPSSKEMGALVRRADGLMMMHQAPRTATDSIGPLSQLIRQVPSTRRHHEPALHVGDRAVDFSLVGSHGKIVIFDGLRGCLFAMRLTRAVGSGVI